MLLSSWQSHCESSPGSFDECRMAPSGRRLQIKPDDLSYESACAGCQSLHPPSPFIIITQPESWYSFYCPMEGRRPSRPGWLVTYRRWFTLPQTVTHPGDGSVVCMEWEHVMWSSLCLYLCVSVCKITYKCIDGWWALGNPLEVFKFGCWSNICHTVIGEFFAAAAHKFLSPSETV